MTAEPDPTYPIPLDPTEGLDPFGPGNASAAYEAARDAALTDLLPDPEPTP